MDDVSAAIDGARIPLPNNSALNDGGAADWLMLIDTMRAGHPHLVTRISESIRTRIPSYRSISHEALEVEVEVEIDRVLRSARAGQQVFDDGDLAELAAIGEARAGQGVPVDDLLRAWRIGIELVVGYAREIAHGLAIHDDQVLKFVQSMLAWSDAAMVTTASAHRRAELARVTAVDHGQTEFVRGALLGAIPAVELRVHAEIYGLDPAGEYRAIRGHLDAATSPHQLEVALGLQSPGDRRKGLAAVIDGDLAGFLLEPPPRDLDGIVGFGPPRRLESLAESYRLAARALVTAAACNLRGAHDLASLGLRSAVAMDADMGELLRRRYLEPLAAGGSPDDLIATLRAYLACGMRVESTATRLFVHQNTVRYRLARFEELTGASLRETEVLIEVWWALELSAMHM